MSWQTDYTYWLACHRKYVWMWLTWRLNWNTIREKKIAFLVDASAKAYMYKIYMFLKQEKPAMDDCARKKSLFKKKYLFLMAVL